MKIYDRNGQEVKGDQSQNNLLKLLYGNVLGRSILKVLTLPFISHVGGWYMSTKFSTRRIKPFIEQNNIDMSQYVKTTYSSYNDFFTRKIIDTNRPMEDDVNCLIAPADSKLSAYKINEDSLFTIKNTVYSLSDLLNDQQLAKEYLNGYCLIFRLTVDDYHRYSFIDDGKVVGSKRINGIFHTVNPIANDYYPIYKQNTRDYSIIETEHFDKVIQMEVGAMMVGRIKNHNIFNCHKGEEKGYFEFGGSTVIVLIKENQVIVDEDIINNTNNDIETIVKLRETIGRKGG